MDLINKLMMAVVAILTIGIFTACEQEFFKDEQYRKEIFIVSGENNIFGQEFSFEDNSEGYLSIYAGGSTAIDRDVMVDLSIDETILREYNQRMYGEKYDNYGLMLPEDRYQVNSMRQLLEASSAKSYSLFPIRVNINGLIPGERYFLPLRIVSVSDYMISPSKGSVLFQIFMKNDYATTKASTYYSMSGTRQQMKENWGNWLPIGNNELVNTTKLVVPVTAQGIRILPSTNQTADGAVLRKQGIVVTVHPDEWVDVAVISDEGKETGEFVKRQKVTLASWFDTDEAVDVRNIDENPSYYDKEKKEYTLFYRYRISSNDNWYEMKEVMKPLEIKNN